ncbi:MAG: surface carbohydrate biosynthesis protein [Alphaproteobacteria bacterium]
MARWLYIPVEVKVRELQAKTLLAAMAARAGYKVVLGRKAELMALLPYVPRGTFLGMWAQENFLKFYKNLKSRGFAISVMDEEGLVTFSDDIYRSIKLSDDTLSYVDLFLSWGAHQSQVIRGCNPNPPPVLAETGNIRFDILRPEFRHLLQKGADELREKHGRFILIVSSFGLCNHFSGAESYFETLKKNKVIRTEADEKCLRSYMELQKKVFESLLVAVPKVAAAFPEHTIIVRPHPSEDHTKWTNAAGDATNVKLIREGDIHQWLLAAEADVHHFCTSALESFVADIPSIAYRPFKEPEIESDLPYRGSLSAETPEQLIESLKRITSGELEELQALRRTARPHLKNYIANLDGAFAYEQMLTAMETHAPETGETISCSTICTRRIRAVLVQIYRGLKKIIGRGENYVDHKFPSFRKKEIADIIKEIPDAGKINIKKIDQFCFLLDHENAR